MSVFDPEKLSVSLLPPATFYQPVEGRKYTLTHSDVTAELFLDIGYAYNYKAINPRMRDEVIAEWKKDTYGAFMLVGRAYIDSGEFSMDIAQRRYETFLKEMSTALQGIIYGDRPLYSHHPLLLDAPIFIHFMSSYPPFNQVVYFGSPRRYY